MHSSEHKGELINCPAEESRGCYIVESETFNAQSTKDTQSFLYYIIIIITIISLLLCSKYKGYIFSAILGEKSTVARGCTSLEDESKYICDTHKAGSYVSISKDKVKKCEFFLFKICEKQKIFSKPRCTHRATAMETVAMRIGTPQDNLRPWRWFSIHGCRRAGS